ncbi:acyltransferase family protein [Salipiger sp. PrR002]|uniref:acyltransferase family protein n=1 Tax=Salipiger sp. PrR002 TaxID=2706489 RepID=UPI0013BB6372|nr:acyltransferase family protein [Salipiger sp. PrR002]NDW00505.1 acyltransferase [Salipiger sp. PrR002]NDW57666.1 acyltransferase [Salipiger sp. PrR004]
MKYRSEIDGLRTVAVLPVILFHAGAELFSGGFVGVDIFFVISGYLITTIIMDELERGDFSILRFYERRAKRILPALFVVCIVSLVLAWLLLQSRDFTDFCRSLVAVASFSSNILFWMEADYFDTAAELKPMLHTWSLAVEEQFYIFFPLLLMALWRFGHKTLVWSLGIICLGSLALAQWQVSHAPMAAFFLLPARAWELGIGAMCAFYLRSGPAALGTGALGSGTRNILSLAGLGLIAFAIFGFDAETPTPSLSTLAPTLGAALIILFAAPGTLAHRLLSLKPMIGIGLISYSAYLWHQPLMAFARHNALYEPPWYVMAGLIALTLFLAWASWKYIETPVRKARVPRLRVFTLSATGITAFIALGLYVHTYDRLDFRSGQYNALDQRISMLSYQNDNNSLRLATWTTLRSYADQLDCLGNCKNGNNQRKWFDDGTDKLRLLLVGNSHSKDMFNLLYLSDEATSRVQTARFNAQIGELTPKNPLFKSANYREADAVMIITRFDDRRGDVSILKDLLARMEADGKRVIIVKSIFEFPTYLGGKWTIFDKVVHEAYAEGLTDGATIAARSNTEYFDVYKSGEQDERVIDANAEIDRLAAEDPGLIVLDRMDYICADAQKTCYSANETLEKYFPDYGHHTMAGAEFFSDRIDATGWLAPVLALADEKRRARQAAIQ